MANKTALILGATGLVGGHLLQFLLESDDYEQVIALVRRAGLPKYPKLKEVVINFDNPEASRNEIKADDVFCCLGTTIKTAGSQEAFIKVDYTYPLEIGRICYELGAKQYLLVSALGANAGSLVFYNRTKGQVERNLKKIGYETVHIMQPSLLLGDRKEVRMGEQIGEVVMGGLKFLMQGPMKKYRAIEAKTVAFAMLYLAQMHETGVHIHPSDAIQAIYDKNHQTP